MTAVPNCPLPLASLRGLSRSAHSASLCDRWPCVGSLRERSAPFEFLPDAGRPAGSPVATHRRARGGVQISDGRPNTPHRVGLKGAGLSASPDNASREGAVGSLKQSAPCADDSEGPSVPRPARAATPREETAGRSPRTVVKRRLREPSFIIPEIADFRRQRVAAADSGCCKSSPDRPRAVVPVRSYSNHYESPGAFETLPAATPTPRLLSERYRARVTKS